MAATTMERGYHNTSSSYVLPNDAIEQDRLDAQADTIVAMIGGAPLLAYNRHLTNASNPVDIGCGTAMVLQPIQLAALLPSANVVGVGISPVPAPALAAAAIRADVDPSATGLTYI
ncbi:hypothetical protein N7449_010543 [Penicillium cf. viridicatum]|uniref:Methyltransferase n=1 Tax=Penicillium cf. viridicatum TaxID=2972119 RepID=A0A9W9J0M2_9EURO|nr:hypothetical protein N7449_010543 [Penicillium cf. viridicatum]